jgi:hypothetical protein
LTLIVSNRSFPYRSTCYTTNGMEVTIDMFSCSSSPNTNPGDNISNMEVDLATWKLPLHPK